MQTVTAKELKSRTTEVLRRVARGEQVIVTRHGKPLAIVKPTGRAPRARPVAARAKALIDEGAGLLAGLGTVDEFLRSRRREAARENGRWRTSR